MTHTDHVVVLAACVFAGMSVLFALEAFCSVRDTLKAIAVLRREIEEHKAHDHFAD